MDSDYKKIKTVGEIIKNAREEANLSIDQIADKTGIAKIQIENIESSNYKYLPAKVYVAGFIKKYIDVLKINPNPIINQFEKEFAALNLGTVNRKLPSLNQKLKFFSIKKIFIIFIMVLLIAMTAYFFRQLSFVFYGPNIVLLNPETDVVLNFDEIEIKGKTDYGSEFTINGENIYIDEKGNFSQKIFLVDGLNRIDIVAKNKFGKTFKVIRNITYQPPIAENYPTL